MTSRRTALFGIASAAVSVAVDPVLAQQHNGHDATDEHASLQPHQPTFFSAAEYQNLSRIVDIIIPRTDTPGALDADVPYRIDQQVAATPALQETFRQGLHFLSEVAKTQNVASFAELPEARQLLAVAALRDPPAPASGRFFKAVKDLTVEWYYRSEQGLVQELGFKGNTFRASFPGCTHPEHWPAEPRA